MLNWLRYRERLETKLDRINGSLEQLTRHRLLQTEEVNNLVWGSIRMAKTLEDILEKVRECNSKGDSLILLIQGLSGRLREALADQDLFNSQAKILEILDEVDRQTNEFQAAIDQNTAPDPVPDPVEDPESGGSETL